MTIAISQITRPTRRDRVEYQRACSRCGIVRCVRDNRARLNLCHDCTQVLSRAERARWAA